MKIRELYSSYAMLAGLVCLVLGIGNWTIGAFESAKYQALLRKTAQTGLDESYHSFRELDLQKNQEALRQINDDREKYNAARVKLNFFYVVLTGGRFLFLIGTALAVFTAVRLIRRDTRIKINKYLGSQRDEK